MKPSQILYNPNPLNTNAKNRNESCRIKEYGMQPKLVSKDIGHMFITFNAFALDTQINIISAKTQAENFTSYSYVCPVQMKGRL